MEDYLVDFFLQVLKYAIFVDYLEIFTECILIILISQSSMSAPNSCDLPTSRKKERREKIEDKIPQVLILLPL